jgi:hypothetical protein
MGRPKPKSVALKAAASRLWRLATKVEAHKTAHRIEPLWRLQTLRDRAD